MKLILKIALGVGLGVLLFWLFASAVVVSSFLMAASEMATDRIIDNAPVKRKPERAIKIKPIKPKKMVMTEKWVKGKSIKECYKIHGNELNVNSQRCRNGYKIKVYF